MPMVSCQDDGSVSGVDAVHQILLEGTARVLAAVITREGFKGCGGRDGLPDLAKDIYAALRDADKLND